jgi:hypothetical protein
LLLDDIDLCVFAHEPSTRHPRLRLLSCKPRDMQLRGFSNHFESHLFYQEGAWCVGLRRRSAKNLCWNKLTGTHVLAGWAEAICRAHASLTSFESYDIENRHSSCFYVSRRYYLRSLTGLYFSSSSSCYYRENEGPHILRQ